MKQYSFDIEVVLKVAKELGIEILPNSSEPGMYFLCEDVSKEIMSFAEFSKSMKEFSKSKIEISC